VTLSNATEVQRALRSGSLEAAALTLDEALTVKQDGFDISVVLVMDFSNGADVLLARPGIDTLADLRGKRVGVESSAVGAVLLHAALEATGLSIADIELVYLTIDEHRQAYESGAVDALVSFEPVRTQLMAAGARVLFDSSRIPERIVDVLVVTPAAAERHGEQLKALIKGHFAAIHYLREKPLEAAARMVEREGVSAASIVDAYQGLQIPDLADNRRLLQQGQPGLVEPTRRLAELMLQQQMLYRVPALEALFDDRWLPGE
jgi:NitT/TauT family transport system substrate-binding protein